MRLFALVFYFSTLALPTFAHQGAAGPVRVREESSCGVYFVAAAYSQEGVRFVDDTIGVKVAGLDVDEVRRYVDTLELKPDGIYFVTGVPFSGSEQRRLTRDIRQILGSNQNTQDIPVRFSHRPEARGLGRAVEEILYMLPKPSDFQKPKPREVVSAMSASVMAEAFLVVFSFSKYDMEIAVPLFCASLTGNAMVNTFRQTMLNWVSRSTGRFWEKIIKESMVSTLFTILYSSAFAYPHVRDQLATEGVFATLQQLPSGLWNILSTKYPIAFTHGVFFATTFGGIYNWQQEWAKLGRAEEVRHAGSVVQNTMFLLSTPLLAWASDPQAATFEVPFTGLSLNGGQVSLVALAAYTLRFWINPFKLDPWFTWVKNVYDPYVSKVSVPAQKGIDWVFDRFYITGARVARWWRGSPETKPNEPPSVDDASR